MHLTFYGAAKAVTGSNYILEADNGEKIMIDCGLFQGTDYAGDKNFRDFPYNPAEVRAVFVTHAHIDHAGRLPKLVSDGYNGPVYSTKSTKAFSEHLLRDSVDILRREAEKFGVSPFCTPGSIEKLMKQWKGVEYHETIQEGPFSVTFFDAGHILGSSFLKVEVDGKVIVFSGDLGNSPAPLIKERELIPQADYVVMESTYGGEKHEPRGEVVDKLEDVIEETGRKGGTLLIPAFAMERTQVLLYHIQKLMEEKKIPEMKVFLDSPLAIRMTDVYDSFKEELDEETQEFLKTHKDLFDFPNLKKTRETEESKAIWKVDPPKIIIAGSGMSQGGRIIHHEKRYLSSEKNTVLIVGYQVEGSLGRKLLDGEKEVEIHGEKIPVRAEIKEISGYSAHADEPQLLGWLYPIRPDVKSVFLVHGELDHMEPLKENIVDNLAVSVEIPEEGQTFNL
jgi:metallo-beta-lactamase family protein